MQPSNPDTLEMDKSTSSSLTTQPSCNRITAGVSRYAYSDVLYIVGLATLGQGIVFLGAPMFLDDITVLPNDPFTLIGMMYTAMGIAFLIISKLFHRSADNCSGTCRSNCFFGKWKSSSKPHTTTYGTIDSPHATDDTHTADEQCCNNGLSDKQDTSATDNNDIPEPEAEVPTVRNRKWKENNDQQWDIVDS